MDSTQTRTLFLRLRHQPPELIEKILIDVPLLQLLEVCSQIPGFSDQMNDLNFWFERARTKYGVTRQAFDEAGIPSYLRNTGRYAPRSGFSSYVATVLDHTNRDPPIPSNVPANDGLLKETPSSVMAEREFTEIGDEMIRQLRHDAQVLSLQPVKSYWLSSKNWLRFWKMDLDIIFQASSLEEVLVQLDDYVRPYGENVFRKWMLEKMYDMLGNYDETPTRENFIHDVIDFTINGAEKFFDIHTLLPRPTWITESSVEK
jgi:hypothetical protein